MIINPYRFTSGAPFVNTKSLEFDGVDDYVNVGNVVDKNKSTAFSISIWVNISSTFSNNILISKVEDRDNGGALSKGAVGYQLYMNNQLYFRFLLDSHFSHQMYVRDGNYWGSSDGLTNGWHHIVGTYDGSGLSSGMTLYVDGYDVSFARVDTGTGNFNNTGDLYVGGQNYNGTPQSSFKGKLDEPCIIPSELTPTEVLDIYNGVRPSGGGVVDGNWQDGTGQPKSMTSYNSDLWLRNGDNGSWKSPQWLIPNNENKDKVSNYSMAFDGLDDSVQTSYIYPSTGDLSVSYWVKTISNSNPQYALSIGAGSLNSGIGKIGFHNAQGHYSIQYQAWDITHTLFQTWTATTPILIGEWYHILYVYDDSTTPGRLSVYLNGQLQTMKDWGNTVSVTQVEYGINNLPLIIGALTLPSSTPVPSNFLNGNVDEVSIFESNESSNALTIYNGGTPTTITGAVSHWKMGDNATFVYGANPDGTWTVPDEVGTNDGTSNNLMADSARVGEAPNSTNNALSLNMDFVDVVPDTP